MGENKSERIRWTAKCWIDIRLKSMQSESIANVVHFEVVFITGDEIPEWHWSEKDGEKWPEKDSNSSLKNTMETERRQNWRLIDECTPP